MTLIESNKTWNLIDPGILFIKFDIPGKKNLMNYRAKSRGGWTSPPGPFRVKD